MTPSIWVVSMLSIVSAIYLAASGGYLHLNRPGMALAFVGYVIANVGLILDVLATKGAS